MQNNSNNANVSNRRNIHLTDCENSTARLANSRTTSLINCEARESENNQSNHVGNLETDNADHVVPDLRDDNFKDYDKVDWSQFDKHVDTAILMHCLNSGCDCCKEIDSMNESNDQQTNNEFTSKTIHEINQQKLNFSEEEELITSCMSK